MKKQKTPNKKKIVFTIFGILGLIAVLVISYLLYVFLTYSRIDDNQTLEVEGVAKELLVETGRDYTITSYNIGFGAYTPDFTFFMDGGTQSRAKSAESVRACTNGALDVVSAFEPDIMLFQEMDTDSTRAHHVNQSKLVANQLEGFQEVFAQNYHSAYLMYPLTCPHGASNSGIGMFSKIPIQRATRIQLPISEDVSKLIDLDRCYSKAYLPVQNGKQLVVYNVHLSAYGADASIKESQFTKLFQDMQQEYVQGNYVICGGDYNSDFTGDSNQVLNGAGAKDAGWTKPFPDQMIPEGIQKCISYAGNKILPTARDCDVPYVEGNFTILVDGFLVSENVDVTYLENVQTGFLYSDHNPVCMKIRLE